MPFLSLPFHRLRYEDTGGHKPALVFCHSFGMRAEMFAPQSCATSPPRTAASSGTSAPMARARPSIPSASGTRRAT